MVLVQQWWLRHYFSCSSSCCCCCCCCPRRHRRCRSSSKNSRGTTRVTPGRMQPCLKWRTWFSAQFYQTAINLSAFSISHHGPEPKTLVKYLHPRIGGVKEVGAEHDQLGARGPCQLPHRVVRRQARLVQLPQRKEENVHVQVGSIRRE